MSHKVFARQATKSAPQLASFPVGDLKAPLSALVKPGFSRMSAADFLRNYDSLHAAAGVTGKTGGTHRTHRTHQVKAPANEQQDGQGQAEVSVAAKKRRKSPEEDLHRLVFDWIFLHEARYPALKYAMHVPNGGARSKGEAGKLKAMGVRKGVPDIINPFPQPGGKGFACELKAPKGKMTPEQDDFLCNAKAQGWITGVCFTLEQFIELITSYLGVRKAGPVVQD